MPDRLLIRNARLIAAFDDRNRKIENGYLYAEGPKIIEMGQGSVDYPADIEIDARGMLMLPGLINTHHHMFQCMTRNIPLMQDAGLFDWLVNHYEIWRHLRREGFFISAQTAIAELLLSGCTTTSDHLYLFPSSTAGDMIDAEIDAARSLGVRFHPTRGSMSRGKSQQGLPPDDVVQSPDAIIADSKRVLDQYHDPSKFSMLQIALAPCAPFNVTSDLMRETVRLAREYGVRLHTHLAETLDEEAYCKKIYGCSPVEYLRDLDWLSSDIWLAHCIHLSDDEITLFADQGVGVAHCPSSNMRLGSGIAPVQKMLDAGVSVGLGVDGSASNDSSNMLAELRLTLLLHRLNPTNQKGLSAEETIGLATRGGAKLLGREDIGSLEVGKAADLIFIDLNQVGFAGGLSDPVASVVFSPHQYRAHTVVVNGRVVVSEGKLIDFDTKNLISRHNHMSQEIIEQASRESGVDFLKRTNHG
ncbi:MAG: 8-oxoguanine deaminase [Candidatus Cloacimonetes bacterium 4572_55]|nr:MAG: 8-oxoguanine deaminase [Candidatus Cloacimonetes bacterium 4572_55]